MTSSAPQPHRPAPIPRGVADYFWHEARTRRRLMSRALQLFERWGYQEVMPPAFEYADTLDRRASPELRDELYRFVDRDGSTLALRGDMTIPVARLVATRLHDVPMPQRFCYAGSVFRYGAGQAGLQREFWQTGVELVGAGEAAADAEVLAITVRALLALDLRDLSLAVGHHGYFDALISLLALPLAARDALLEAIDRNSDAALAAFLQETPLADDVRSVIVQLPHLSGSNTAGILERARALALTDSMRAAVADLEGILEAYDAYNTGVPLYLDLTEIHKLGYYTGLTFEALTPALGFPVASGGRYDQLVGSFGAAQPAVGAAILLDRVLLALNQAAAAAGAARPIAPFLLAGGALDDEMMALIDECRSMGASVQVDFSHAGGIEALLRRAILVGAAGALHREGTDLRLGTEDGVREIDEDDVIYWIVDNLDPEDDLGVDSVVNALGGIVDSWAAHETRAHGPNPFRAEERQPVHSRTAGRSKRSAARGKKRR